MGFQRFVKQAGMPTFLWTTTSSTVGLHDQIEEFSDFDQSDQGIFFFDPKGRIL